MGIINKIKQGIAKRIKFHKRLMFIGSLYGCIVNRNKNEFVDGAIAEITKCTPLKTREIQAIKKEINYRIAKEIPFNTCIIMDTSCYKTKLNRIVEENLIKCFKEHPIPQWISEQIERDYISAVSCKPDVVQKGLVTLVHGMNINVGMGAVKLPLFLQHVLWDNKSFKMLVKENDNVDEIADKIITLSPTNLWYGSKDKMKEDVKKIVIYIRDKL